MIRRALVAGAVSGAVSAFVFTGLHDWLISDIWFSLPVMLGAGAVCGLTLAWTYGLCVDAPSMGSWARYNLLHVALFAVLGAVSVLVYEPVTTVAALIAANEPPEALFRQALPMTLVFTLCMAALVYALYGRRWWHFGPVLLTSVVLVALLGLNVSVIGLVFFTGGEAWLIAELFALIVALDAVYAAVFWALRAGGLSTAP